MKKAITALLLCLGLTVSGAATAEGTTGNINVFLGGKGLDDEDWLADSHGEIGLLIDIGGKDWPLMFAVDMLRSSGDFDGFVYRPSDASIHYYEEDVKTRELNLGVRKYWHPTSNMYPYLGGGLAFVRLEAEWRYDGGTLYSDSGSGTGVWLGGGVQWRFDQFNIGFSIRASGAEVALDSGDYQGGGGHSGLVFGYHW
jgi:opacity protein-like surface antigen